MKKRGYIIVMSLAVMMSITIFSTDAYADKPGHANGPRGLGQIKKEIEKKEKEAKEKFEEQINLIIGSPVHQEDKYKNEDIAQSSQVEYEYSSTIGTETTSNTTLPNTGTSHSTYVTEPEHNKTQLNTIYQDNREDSNQSVSLNQLDKEERDQYSESEQSTETDEYDPANMMNVESGSLQDNFVSTDNTLGSMRTNESKADMNEQNNEETLFDAKNVLLLVFLCIGLVVAIILTLKKYKQLDEDEDFEMFEFEDVFN